MICRLTPQRLQIIELYCENQCSVQSNFCPLEVLMVRIIELPKPLLSMPSNLETHFTLLDDTQPFRIHLARTEV